MPKEMGGDNPSSDKWMENCVKKVMATGKEKSNAVAICKSTWMKSHGNKDKASVDLSLYLYYLLKNNN